MHLPPPLPPRSSHGPKCSQTVDFTLCQLSAKTVEPCLSGCAPSCAMATCVCLCVCVRARMLFSHWDKSSIIDAVLGEECTLNWNTHSLQRCHMHKSLLGRVIWYAAGPERKMMTEVGRTTALRLWSTLIKCYCKWSSHSLYCWFSRRLRRGLGEGVDGRLAGRVLTNLRGEGCLYNYNFFVLHASYCTSQAGLIVPESCAPPKQNIYPQFWLPAKHMLCFIFHMFPRRQKRLSERCTFQF